MAEGLNEKLDTDAKLWLLKGEAFDDLTLGSVIQDVDVRKHSVALPFSKCYI